MLKPRNITRWTACPKSAAPSDGPTRSPGELTMECRAAQMVADAILRGDATSTQDMIGRLTADDYEITPEIAADIEPFIARIRSVTDEPPVTDHVNIPALSIDGRTDVFVFDLGTELIAAKIEYGFKHIEAFENWDLILALLPHASENHQRFTVGIYQPRIFHADGPWRFAEISPQRLAQYAQHLTVNAANAAQQTHAVSGTHCAGCSHASGCSALTEDIGARFTIVAESEAVFRKPTGAELAAELNFLQTAEELLRIRRRAVEADAEIRIRDGEFVPGYWMRPTYARDREFSVSRTAAELMLMMPLTTEHTMTPADAEKAGASRTVLDQISHRPERGRKLARMTRADADRVMKTTVTR